MHSGLRVIVGLATYNERDNLATLVTEIFQFMPQFHLLIIDDASPDGTGKLADELASQDDRVKVVHRAGKLGLGTASLTGMRYAMAHNYDCYLSMDADFSHQPRYLPAVMAGMDDHDLMIGSRYVAGGGVENWPISRYLISRSVNLLTRWMLWLPVRDASGAYRCYRTDLLRRTRLDNMLSHGYSFQQEVLFRCIKAGARVGETPIIFAERRAGSSKVDLREIFRSLFALFRIGFLSVFGSRNRFVLEDRAEQHDNQASGTAHVPVSPNPGSESLTDQATETK